MTRLEAIEYCEFKCTTRRPPGGDTEIVEWFDERPQPETWDEIFAMAQAIADKKITISDKRAELNLSFRSLPPEIRGPFRTIFETIIILLDEEDYDASIAALSAQPVPPEVDPLKQSYLAELIAIKGINDA